MICTSRSTGDIHDQSAHRLARSSCLRAVVTPDRITKIAWDWGADGADHAEIVRNPDGWQISGANGATRYRITTDASGAATKLNVNTTQELTLRRGSQGWWYPDGRLIAGSANALDPDIACTALTNTLPIRRLGLAIGATAEIDVLYIPVPALEPAIVRQCYTRQADGYLYENRDSGFRAFLSVDAEGWVTHYPGVCDMMEPSQ
ncbi:putative glycolipid-binding domain-containing protein [Yoonia sp. R2-816]|uniref:putative glycolipid-binding domain-containing protein n=1 Tax=Yoonia sp. R2-816 TaxID=3342638 RepID=UPI0037266FEC